MGKKTILVIEDSADMRALVSVKLKKHGYDTVWAADAMQAMTVARQTQPDAIILDLGLPAGNGFLVMERLKGHPQLCSIPVIILTADQSVESEFKGIHAGAMAFLRKPLQEEALIDTVRYAVGDAAECPITDVDPITDTEVQRWEQADKLHRSRSIR